jgi:putative endonuclease
VLKSQKDKKLYIGYSANLQKRFLEHQKGEVESTKYRRPLELIFYEAFRDKRDAMRREKYFKTDKGKSSPRQVIRFSGE